MLSTIRLMYAYTQWADERMFTALTRLTDEQWLRPLGSSHSSIRDTAVHTISAQGIWLSRWKGLAAPQHWNPADFPTPKSLETRWREHATGFQTFVAAQTENALLTQHTITNLKGEVSTQQMGGMMLHVANHSTYHRGQVATLLRQLGAVPEVTDLIFYLRQHPQAHG